MLNELIDLKRGGPRKYAARRIRDVHRQPCTEGTLANLASDGDGPVYRLIAGRAYYLDDDIDDWALSRVSAPIRKAADARRTNASEAA